MKPSDSILSPRTLWTQKVSSGFDSLMQTRYTFSYPPREFVPGEVQQGRAHLLGGDQQASARAVVEVDVRDLRARRQRGSVNREVVVLRADLHSPCNATVLIT